jgi:hypothetical protein
MNRQRKTKIRSAGICYPLEQDKTQVKGDDEEEVVSENKTAPPSSSSSSPSNSSSSSTSLIRRVLNLPPITSFMTHTPIRFSFSVCYYNFLLFFFLMKKSRKK